MNAYTQLGKWESDGKKSKRILSVFVRVDLLYFLRQKERMKNHWIIGQVFFDDKSIVNKILTVNVDTKKEQA